MNKKARDFAHKFKDSIFEKKNLDSFTLGGDKWVVVKDPNLPGRYGQCDVRNKIITIRDDRARIHELVHAHFYYYDRQYTQNEEMVVLVANRLDNWHIYKYETMD